VDHKLVDKLEREIENAMAETVAHFGLGTLPLLPSRHTMHLMAKAAVTVYKAAVANSIEETNGLGSKIAKT